ncbi:Structural maintenance of chromosomes protein 5, partial [Linum perenne]
CILGVLGFSLVDGLTHVDWFCCASIKHQQASWFPKLRNLVEQISGTFSRNFQEMAVAGEVSLDEHDKYFDQYGILIEVKFR